MSQLGSKIPESSRAVDPVWNARRRSSVFVHVEEKTKTKKQTGAITNKKTKKKNHGVFAFWSVWSSERSHAAAAAAVCTNYDTGGVQWQDLAAPGDRRPVRERFG